MELKRVVVTGIGALTPLGNSAPAYWDGLKRGQSGSRPITRYDASRFKTQFACEVKDFDILDHMDRKEARKLDPYSHYAVVAAEEAVQDSGILHPELDVDRVGVIWGSGIGGLKTFMDEVINYARGDGTPRFNPFFIPKMIADIAAGLISMRYSFRGPNYSTVSACASSNNAIIDAFFLIRYGKADAFVCGGSEAAINEAAMGGFSAMHALSTRNDDPAGASRPFDQTRDGFVMGEGAGALILEELEHAKRRGATIYCEIAGGGMSADAHHITAPHPEGLGALNVMRRALEDASLTTKDVDYINVHGTSTPLGDIAETKAIKQLFGEHVYKLNISSTKSMTGHLLGAAGAIEALACILAVKESIIPPTINFKHPDPEIDQKINFTFNEAQKREVEVAMSNTFGFGGHNTSAIFKKYRG